MDLWGKESTALQMSVTDSDIDDVPNRPASQSTINLASYVFPCAPSLASER